MWVKKSVRTLKILCIFVAFLCVIYSNNQKEKLGGAEKHVCGNQNIWSNLK